MVPAPSTATVLIESMDTEVSESSRKFTVESAGKKRITQRHQEKGDPQRKRQEATRAHLLRRGTFSDLADDFAGAGFVDGRDKERGQIAGRFQMDGAFAFLHVRA